LAAPDSNKPTACNIGVQESTRAGHTIRVGELDIEYSEAGVGTRPFVMVHGFTGSRDDFADVLDDVAVQGRTIVPDLRGHGGTTNPGRGYDFDQLCRDLLGFLDALDISKCDLLGHSLGGMIVLRFALDHPERVHSLVLMDTSDASHRTRPSWPERILKFAVRRLPMRWNIRALRANQHRLPEPAQRAAHEMGSDRYWNRLRIKLEAMDPIAFDALLDEIMNQEGVTNRLGEIPCPTLVMVGDQDAAFRKPSQRMANQIPDAELVVLKDAHHSPQIEAPGQWLSTIAKHLKRARTSTEVR
jgi:pimeloyl-ACP methyl ester carboxylesterase